MSRQLGGQLCRPSKRAFLFNLPHAVLPFGTGGETPVPGSCAPCLAMLLEELDDERRQDVRQCHPKHMAMN